MSRSLARARLPIAAAAATLLAALLPSAAHARGVQHRSAPRLAVSAKAVRLAVPRTAVGPGYQLVIQRSPFRITTVRGGHTVLATTPGRAGSSGPADFHTQD